MKQVETKMGLDKTVPRQCYFKYVLKLGKLTAEFVDYHMFSRQFGLL